MPPVFSFIMRQCFKFVPSPHLLCPYLPAGATIRMSKRADLVKFLQPRETSLVQQCDFSSHYRRACDQGLDNAAKIKKMASFVGLSLKDASGQTYVIILSETDFMLGKDFFKNIPPTIGDLIVRDVHKTLA